MTLADIPAEARVTVMGAAKAQVDELLKGWSQREDGLSTQNVRTYRYTQDVTLIVFFRSGKAVGVAVIDNPGLGIEGISEPRFRELVRVIGGGNPKAGDLKHDSQGIREFYVGNIESD